MGPTDQRKNNRYLEEFKNELEFILASTHFRKATRLRKLLDYLAEQVFSQSARETNEYAIGLDVFDRDPSQYSTGSDPIVRVQIGRLREKLKLFYQQEGKLRAQQIEIPLGSYLPILNNTSALNNTPPRFCLQPLINLGQDQAFLGFTLGLTEELSYALHRRFGTQYAGVSIKETHPSELLKREISHVLEGSVRHDLATMRTSLRMCDLKNDCLTWCENFDVSIDVSIEKQSQLARLCSEALQLISISTVTNVT